MRIPLEITFHGVAESPAIEAAIRERAEWLERFSDDITACRVVVEAPHRRRQQGTHYRVRVDVTVPGDEIVAGRAPPKHGAHEDVYVSIRDAFRAVRRRLEDFERKRRGKVKRHTEPHRGRVARIFPDEGYGFVEADDGHEIYFHRNSVLDGFDALRVGTKVRYAEESGERGPQASTISIAGGQRGAR